MKKTEILNLLEISNDDGSEEIENKYADKIDLIKNELNSSKSIPRPLRIRKTKECKLLESLQPDVAQLIYLCRAKESFQEIEQLQQKDNFDAISALKAESRISGLKEIISKILDKKDKKLLQDKVIEIDYKIKIALKKSTVKTNSKPPFDIAAGTKPTKKVFTRSPFVKETKIIVEYRLKIPEPFKEQYEKGELLKLIPHKQKNDKIENKTLPIHFIARPKISLGRNSSKVDIPVLFLPKNKENDAKSIYVGGKHVELFLNKEKHWVRDLNSKNGTTLNNKNVIYEEPAVLKNNDRLILGTKYELTFNYCESRPEYRPKVEKLPQAISTDQQPDIKKNGYVSLRTISCKKILFKVVWLFTDVNIGIDPNDSLSLENSGLSKIPGRIHYWKKCFWFENFCNNTDEILVNDTQINKNEIVPLISNQKIKLGNSLFNITIE